LKSGYVSFVSLMYKILFFNKTE